MSGSADPVDPKPALVKKAHDHCKAEWTRYQECAQRVANMAEPKSCGGWYNDYWKCIDDKVT